jgi:hypothetical protein
MPNYGDVSLQLGPDWDRRLITNKKFAMWIIGHDHGKSDAYLKKEPDKRHQLIWVDPRYHEELAMNLSANFVFVNKDEWTINENLWQWNAEGHAFNQGQLMMARPAALWFAQKAEVDRELAGRKDEDFDAAIAIADKAGIPIEHDGDQRKAARR